MTLLFGRGKHKETIKTRLSEHGNATLFIKMSIIFLSSYARMWWMAFNFAAFLLKRGKAEISDLRLLCVGERQVAIVKFYGTRREKGNISVLSFALCLPCSTFYVTYPSDKFSCNASTRLLLYVFYPPVDITKIAPLMPFSIIHFQDRDGGRNLRAFIGLWWVYT